MIRKTEAGTTIDRAPFLRNWKSVRESLGLMMGHNFLVSDRTLLVCGPSDQVIRAGNKQFSIINFQGELLDCILPN